MALDWCTVQVRILLGLPLIRNRKLVDIQEYIKLPLIERQNHLNLNETCLERGGMSTYFKGLLAHVLNTSIPSGSKILVCHACGNGKCSNPNHLYFGTPKENVADGYRHGTMINPWQASINKYGKEETLKRARAHQKEVNGYSTYYITNGVKNKRINHGDSIPEGWRKGKTYFVNPSTPTIFWRIT